MSKTITVQLERSISGHGGPVHQLRFREPMYDDIMEHGHPYSVHTAENGQGVIVYDHAAIRFYTERCLVEPRDPLLLTQVGMGDTFKVREAIIGFFLPSAAAGADSKTSPTTSGEDAGSAPTPSAA